MQISGNEEVSTVKKSFDKIAGSKDMAPTDARSVFNTILGSGTNATDNSKEIITLSNLHMVCGMPPMGDNIVDPPPFLNTSSKASDKIYGTTRTYASAFSTGLAGMDYIERNIVGGNFLILVPLELSPNLLGNALSKLKLVTPEKLSSLAGRLGVSDYGLESKVATRRYWRSYTMLLKAAAMALGVDRNSGAYTEEGLRDRLPSYMYDNLIGIASEAAMFRFNDTGAKGDGEGTSQEQVGIIEKESIDSLEQMITKHASVDNGYVATNGVTADGVTSVSSEVGAEGIHAIIQGSSYINLMKYMTNMDDSVTANERLPIISFYINGTVERNFSSSNAIDESKVARHTTDMIRTGVAGQAPQDVTDYATELAYHGRGPSAVSFALSNTAIPKVISDTATDFSYNIKISEKSIGSDPISLLKVSNLYSLIEPFITPVSDGRQNTVVPNAPLYCAAHVKGVMNVPRGAITSAQITTNPQFQTSEGIPTEMDVVITIQPLLSVSTMPNFGRFFSNTDETALVAAMYNPMSAFNIIATLCGYNTVLTKYPFTLFEYFIKGKISSFFTNIRGVGNFISTGANDFMGTSSMLFGQKVMPT